MPSSFKYMLTFAAVPLAAFASPVSFHQTSPIVKRNGNVTTPTAPSQWVHPGVLVSGSQLDFVKQQVAAKKDPWYTAYNAMLGDDLIKGSTTPSPVPTVACGAVSKNPDVGCHPERENALTAYGNSLAYWISGEQKYADTAIRFMDAWAKTLKAHADPKDGSGSINTPLQTGWAGAPWSRAAEIIKHGNASWPGADAFGDMLRNAYVPWLINGSDSNGNWELVMTEALQGIAVFLEDADLYNKAMQLYVKRVPAYVYLASADGDIPVPGSGVGKGKEDVIKYWQGQASFGERADGVAQETCRDLTHTGYGLSSISHVAETSRIQGADLYVTEIGERLRYGLGFHSAFAGNYENVPSWLCHGALKQQDQMGPVTEVGYNALAFRLNNTMTNTRKYTESKRPAGSDLLFIGWETLTHAQNPA